ncbi:transcriptional regulator [Lacticaseibacillus casei]|nr:transcriptional regulator [Lacticaseibacillus casei]
MDAVVRVTRYFSPIDHDKTIENAKEVLGNYWHHKRLAQRTKIALRSPVMDGMPKSPSYGNKAEEKVISHADELYYVECCESAVDAIEDEDYRTILSESYLIPASKRKTNEALFDLIGVGKTAYQDKKKQALIAFGELCPLVKLERTNGELYAN